MRRQFRFEEGDFLSPERPDAFWLGAIDIKVGALEGDPFADDACASFIPLELFGHGDLEAAKAFGRRRREFAQRIDDFEEDAVSVIEVGASGEFRVVIVEVLALT